MRGFFGHLFRKPSDKSADAFYAVVEKHGYGEVPAREVYAVFEGMASPALGGFSIIKPGTFARQVNEDIVHTVRLQARKGGAYTICWGVSLPFVPEVCGGCLRWHRTLKSARFDLWEDPFEYFTNPGNYIAQNGHGTQYLRETMTAMWSAMNDPIQSWFRGGGDLTALLSRAEEQEKRKWQGPRHFPEPQLVRTFILHRLGRSAEARAVLDDYIAHDGISTTDADLLSAALDK